MKLVSFEVDTSFAKLARIGAIISAIGSINEAQIVDLNLAGVKYLQDVEKRSNAYELASLLMPPDMLAFLECGEVSKSMVESALEYISEQLKHSSNADLVGSKGEKILHPLPSVKLLAPVPQPRSLRDFGTFETHMKRAAEITRKSMPKEWYEIPIYYRGNPYAVVGPESTVIWPKYTEKLDYELEWGIYIGKKGKNIPKDQAESYIAGYTIYNDISARDIQFKYMMMSLGPGKGKDFDTSNVMGPCLVTPDEIPEPYNLKMTARVNGEVWSEGNTNDMYYTFADLISYISQHETLQVGEFFGSGTVGRGCGWELDRWIKPGDVIELEVERIGVLRNNIGQKGEE